MTPQEAKALAMVAVGKIEAHAAADQRHRDEMRQSFLTDQEMEQVILAVFRSRGDDGIVTDEEVKHIINEIITIRFMNSCTELVLKGLLNVDYDPTLPPNERLVFKARRDIQGSLKEALQRRATGGS